MVVMVVAASVIPAADNNNDDDTPPPPQRHAVNRASATAAGALLMLATRHCEDTLCCGRPMDGSARPHACSPTSHPASHPASGMRPRPSPAHSPKTVRPSAANDSSLKTISSRRRSVAGRSPWYTVVWRDGGGGATCKGGRA